MTRSRSDAARRALAKAERAWAAYRAGLQRDAAEAVAFADAVFEHDQMQLDIY